MRTDRLLSAVRAIADRSVCRPALAVSALFALGIGMCRSFPACPFIALGVLLGGVVGAVLLQRRAVCAEICLSIALVCAGLTAGQLALYFYSSDNVGLRAGDEPRPIEVEAVVTELPRLQAPANPHLPPRQVFTASVTHVRSHGEWINATGDLPVSVGRPVDGLFVGQRVHMTGLISCPRPANNPGEFDSSAFYRARRQLATLSVPHGSGIQFIDQSTTPLHRGAWLPTFRNKARDALDRGFDIAHEPDRQLLGALVFGDRPSGLKPDIDLFQRAGLLHLLSSNGTRIALLVGAIFWLGRMLGLSPRAHLVAMIVVIVIAGLLVQVSPQVIRPVLVGGAVILALLWRRNVDPVQLVSLTAMGLLLLNPMDFFAAGFQLSFAIVLGLALLTRPMLKALADLDAQDRRMARRLAHRRPASPFKAIAAWLIPRVLESFKFGIGAWLIATPLIMFHFEQCNLWSAPLGVLVAPLVVMAIIAGFLKTVLTLLLPGFAPAWAAMAAWLPPLVRHVLQLIARMPGSNVPVSAPSIGWLIAWYALLGLILVYLRRRVALAAEPVVELDDDMLAPLQGSAPLSNSTSGLAGLWSRLIRKPASVLAPLLLPLRDRISAALAHRNRLRRWAMPIVWLMPAMACFLWLVHPPDAGATDGRARGDELCVTLLAVGAGQCAVVQVPGGDVDLFDAGSDTLVDPWHGCVEPFLRHLGRSRADRVFLSHGDFDHISAVPAMLPDHCPGEVDISPHLQRCAAPGEFADRLLSQLKKANIPTHLIWADPSIGPQPLGSGGATIEVLWPPAACAMNSNNTGLVLRVSYGGHSILFPADIQEPAERALLRLPPGSLHADVLVAPHHGSSESASAEFVAAVAPQFVVSSNGSRLTNKQRTFDEIVRKLPLYRTSRGGAITIRFTRDGKLDVQTFDSQRPAPPLDAGEMAETYALDVR